MIVLMPKPQTLPDFTALVVDEPYELQKEPFRVDSNEKAQWASSRYLEAEKRIQERSDLASRYIERINAWLEKANKDDLDTLVYFRSLLKTWLEDRLTGIRSRSLVLPGVRLGFRKKPDRVEVTNPLDALDFCQAQVPEAVVVKKELSKTELKRVLTLGVCVPGAELVPGEDELTIKED